MAIPGRWVHFWGSAPRDPARGTDSPRAITERAVAWMLRVSGGNIRSLPDGETDQARDFWVQGILERLGEIPGVRLVRPADWSRNRPPQYKKAFGRPLSVQAIRDALRSEELARASLGGMRRLLPQGVSFQVGFPSPIVWGLAFRPGSLRIPRYMRTFRRATAQAINAIQNMAPYEVEFQLELPMETVLLAKLAHRPLPLQRLMAWLLARSIIKLVKLTRPGTRFIVHLCWGDFNQESHKALVTPDSLLAPVLLANALSKGWPKGHALLAIGIPLAFGDQPAPTEEGYYRCLEMLRVHCDLIAGAAHPTAPVGDQAAALVLAELYAGSPFVGVAAPCGLGRVDSGTAEATMQAAARLARIPSSA